MTDQPTVLLNDGHTIPQLGLGVWQAGQDVAVAAVRKALEVGYRHVDTAAVYGNEREVGEGMRASGVARGDIFLTTKLWNDAQGHDNALRAFDASLERLGVDYVDLYLIHWPMPRLGTYVETWKALIELKNSGRARSIGVSNFNAEHLERIIGETGVVPALNQVELHPHFQQRALRAFHAEHAIATQSWSPLGQGRLLADPAIAVVARKHGRTPAQTIIRWHLDNGLIAIPKSVTPARIEENFAVFDFTLDAEDIAAIGALDSAQGRIGSDPLTAHF
ncbi:2,5-diketo-D-gluconate reductase A [Pseudochelatococcus lubricantis]|uniref:2,5-diketo-D-gluconate reductase A n=1 Tax=Pseudochelatococcus lubricantis TaxID=1538102 RepID=A0ABX0UWU6_9HYPH|nr:aldo/keto reductase [Pseudochelatococcus lubricantis]NIJ57422.1 2,5-diketo-D-gluconate reductase A [Pseudochelatococcus lubricantis]